MDEMAQPQRIPITLDIHMQEAFICCWNCQQCGRGVSNEFRYYEEDDIEYGEATCLRCGETTRYPLNEID
jgi:RNase P subunit RPR2